MLWLDLETRSQTDLVKNGLLRYAQDPTTEVICMSYGFDDDPILDWFAEDEPFPQAVKDYIATGKPISAHNASFERHMFEYVIGADHDCPVPKLEQWRCTSARAMAHGLPGSLADVCRALKLPVQKQTEGKRLIREYSAPGFKTEWEPGDKELMRAYCNTDVVVMRFFCSMLRDLTDEEWNQYHVTERINDRGVPVNISFVEAALRYADDVREDISASLAQLTDGLVTKASQRKLRDEWLVANTPPEMLELITVETGGIEKIKFDKEHRAILAQAPELPDKVGQFIELIEQAGGATIAKYSAMLNTHVDGRVHGSLIWNGAGATGRYSSRGLQLQNFRRDVFKDPEPIIESVVSGSGLTKPADDLGRLIRSTITSDQELTFSDYSQIEARVLPWLSGDPRAETTLDIFRAGRDLYSENALYMFNLQSPDQVTPDLRQAAKQGCLACGFGGGGRAVQAMAKNYGVKYEFEKADYIKTKWRAANPWAEPFWYGLKDAARSAFDSPGTVTLSGRLRFQSDGRDFLWMMLPSGRVLAYLKPKVEIVELPWGDEGFELTCLWGSGKPKAGEKWPRRVVNHLILSENATQGTAADIMRETIVRADSAGLPVLFSVHDELVVEGRYFDEVHRVMTQAPAWAEGLPIDADTQCAKYYGK